MRSCKKASRSSWIASVGSVASVHLVLGKIAEAAQGDLAAGQLLVLVAVAQVHRNGQIDVVRRGGPEHLSRAVRTRGASSGRSFASPPSVATITRSARTAPRSAVPRPR